MKKAAKKKSFLRRAAKIVALGLVAFAVLVCLLGFLLLQGFRVKMPDCEKGPLQTMNECAKDHSTYSWMNSGWWYSDARGALRPEICQAVQEKTSPITFESGDGRRKFPRALEKMNCAELGLPEDIACYRQNRTASNGNTWYVYHLIVHDCAHARYFEGSKAYLAPGSGGKEPYAIRPFACESFLPCPD